MNGKMKTKNGYKSIPLSSYRQAVIASASVTKKKNAIHSLTEVDITEPRHLMEEHFARTGEKLSLTAYIVTCLAQLIKQHPQLNSFIKGRRLIILDDVTVSVLIEREMADKNIHMAKTYGKVAVTAAGMFSKEAVWFIPHGSATVFITVGSISQKVVEIEGQFVSREHLCLTVSFDHNIVDSDSFSKAF
jgi:pyruvate/2-oxoglutarate dehydrogenase complex dihydrolipoamide acyltransferase (E2) component